VLAAKRLIEREVMRAWALMQKGMGSLGMRKALDECSSSKKEQR